MGKPLRDFFTLTLIQHAHFWHQMCGVPTHCTKQFSATPTGGPRTQFCSSTNWCLCRTYRWRAQPRKAVPSSDANPKSQVVTCTSDRLAINGSFSDSCLGFDNLLDQLTKFRKILVCWFITKDLIKNSPRKWWVGKEEELGCPLPVHHPPSTSTRSPTWKFSLPYPCGLYGAFIMIDH